MGEEPVVADVDDDDPHLADQADRIQQQRKVQKKVLSMIPEGEEQSGIASFGKEANS